MTYASYLPTLPTPFAYSTFDLHKKGRCPLSANRGNQLMCLDSQIASKNQSIRRIWASCLVSCRVCWQFRSAFSCLGHPGRPGRPGNPQSPPVRVPHSRHQQWDRHKLCALCLRLVDFLHWTRCINHKWQRGWYSHTHTHTHSPTYTHWQWQGCSFHSHVVVGTFFEAPPPQELVAQFGTCDKLKNCCSQLQPAAIGERSGILEKRLTKNFARFFLFFFFQPLSGTCSRPPETKVCPHALHWKLLAAVSKYLKF